MTNIARKGGECLSKMGALGETRESNLTRTRWKETGSASFQQGCGWGLASS